MKNVYILVFALLLSGMLKAQERLLSYEQVGLQTRSTLNVIFGQLVDVQNGVELYAVTYLTPNVQGELDTASGLIIKPDVQDQPLSIALLEHGTVDGPDDVPSNLQGNAELGIIGGAVGYLACMPDYLGLGQSDGFHPYVHRATEASASVDMLRATLEFAEAENVALDDNLYLTGYSQGGHASMATHELIETQLSSAFTVTGAAHLSGPYSISTVFPDVFLSEEEYFFPGYATYTLMGYNEVYGLYDSLEQWVKQPYADLSMEFYRAEVTLSELHQNLADSLLALEGEVVVRSMLQDSFLTNFQTDMDHPLRLALRDNDTYLFAPQAPTRLYYCMADDQVSFRNSLLADSVMNELGGEDIFSLDLNSELNHVECVFPALTATVDFFTSLEDVTSVEDKANPLQVQFFPNPVSDVLQLRGLPAGSELRLYNMQGVLLQRWQDQEYTVQIPVYDLPNGTYAIVVRSDQGQQRHKILVAH